jgi:hypothetical protein
LILAVGLFRWNGCDETIPDPTKPFWAFGAELRKPRMVINATRNTATQAPQGQTGDSQMRTMSFILAFAFVMAGTSLAGSVESDLPGIGTFSYNGSPVAAPHTLVVAAR